MKAERLRGRATVDGTRQGAERFGAGARTLGRTGLTVAPVGFGAHRVRVESALHRRALADALRQGMNLVDTSTSHGDGASEALVGTVLANLAEQGDLRREHVVVVSKVGYVREGGVAREVARVREGLWHCMHPDFIVEQLNESLGRLRIEHLDVLLLHDPESYLLDAARRGVDEDERRRAYDDRLLRAFETLEELAQSGRIGFYGVSSNGFAASSDDASFTSVARLLELAQRAGGDQHHFAVVQMPMNLLELGAVSHPHETPAGPRSPLAIASEADLGILIGRPLDAIAEVEGEARRVRLVDEPDPGLVGTDSVRQALARVRKLEAQWATGLGKRLVTPEGDDAVDLFRWGQELGSRLDEIGDLAQWQHLRHDVVAPTLGRTSAALLDALQGPTREDFASWWTAYGAALHHAFESIEQVLRSRRKVLVQAIARALDPHLPASWRALPLSGKAVLTLLAAPVSSVLVGMRHPAYVVDMLALREHTATIQPVSFPTIDRAVRATLANPHE